MITDKNYNVPVFVLFIKSYHQYTYKKHIKIHIKQLNEVKEA